ncbi:MAG: phosphoribosylglycinamide formyltransferase 1 [Rhodospirillaceae bacterium]|nr:MAG: phosphoribosylglycinamide formyltransferase 1 [Rhodospirillaceae bacterium]
MARLKVAVLISGRGSNLQALIDATTALDFPAKIIQVISDVPAVVGLTRAVHAGVPTAVIDPHDYAGRPAFEAALDRCLRDAGAQLLCLAGFMRLLTADFVAGWPDRILNIHPSLLPAFRGLHTHTRALAAGVRFTGCTVHFVRPAMDEGPIVAQAVVPVLSGDDPDRLAARVLEAEHRLYPLALRLVATGQARVREEVVDVNGTPAPSHPLLNPQDQDEEQRKEGGERRRCM